MQSPAANIDMEEVKSVGRSSAHRLLGDQEDQDQDAQRSGSRNINKKHALNYMNF